MTKKKNNPAADPTAEQNIGTAEKAEQNLVADKNATEDVLQAETDGISEEIALEADGGAALVKPHRKVLKVVVVIFLEIALLCAGLFFGYVYAKATIPQGVVLSEYKTIEELREEYGAVADEKKSVQSYVNAKDYYGLYATVYYKLITATDVYLMSTGLTDSLGMVKVSIESEKKLENGYMVWHMNSSGDSMPSQTTFSVNGYFDIVNQMVKVKRYNNKGAGDSKNGKEQSELAFVSKYGLLPFAFSNYYVTEENILSAECRTENGLNVLTLTLDAERATEGYVVQMSGMSGQKADFSDGSVVYTMMFDDNFILRKTASSDEYVINYGIKVSCKGNMEENYYYKGEEGYVSFTEEEKYENVAPDA